MRYFTEEEMEIIRQYYTANADNLDLSYLANKLGRTKHLICRKARGMGLTAQHRKVPAHLVEIVANKLKGVKRTNKGTDYLVGRIRNGDHPRGMKGKTHTEKVRKNISDGAKRMWNNPKHRVNSEEYRQMLSNRAVEKIVPKLLKGEKVYSRSKSGKREDLGFYVRSEWEANYARYLNFFQGKGMILKYEYEPDTFWFDQIKRGTRSYTPDFKVWINESNFEYHEVKGWLDKKSQTKLKRMSKYYPNIKIVLIGKEEYKEIKKWSRLIPSWED